MQYKVKDVREANTTRYAGHKYTQKAGASTSMYNTGPFQNVQRAGDGASVRPISRKRSPSTHSNIQQQRVFLQRDVSMPAMTSQHNNAGARKYTTRLDIQACQVTDVCITAQASTNVSTRTYHRIRHITPPCSSLHQYTTHLPILLIRAGDVELNPGPDGNDCYKCQKPLMKRKDVVIAAICITCGNKSHKGPECSGVKKGKLNEATWKCQICAPPPPVKTCRECKKEERQGQNFLECTLCNDTVHNKDECSMMKKSARDKIPKDSWKCLKCTCPEKYERERRGRKKNGKQQQEAKKR